MGWDVHDLTANTTKSNFNPPTPYGVGQRFDVMDPTLTDFNPPTPYGVGLDKQRRADRHFAISIHPPRMGWDVRFALEINREGDFNPPTPYGVGPECQKKTWRK